MRILFFTFTLFIAFIFTARAQTSISEACPKVKLTVALLKNTFKLGEDIQLTMTLQNTTETTQSVWFDNPKSSTGGPAWTWVTLVNKKTGKSILKYQNKAVLNSQAYSTEEVKNFSYQLTPGQSIQGQFSLYDLVVLKGNVDELRKETYRMQVFYCSNPSNTISFIVK